MVQTCEYLLPIKKRRCKFEARPGFKFCGNHMPNSLQPERKRIPCPWDPSHTVYEAELRQHAFKCPSHLFQLKNQAQPYCQPDVNAGQQEDALHLLASNNQSHAEQGAASSQQYVQALGQDKFLAFIHRIVNAHQQACSEQERLHPLTPPECEAYLKPDNERPFSLKHAQQQASIVGHMKQSGLLQNAERHAYIEFGAGKGYLSSMLADSSAARHFVLLDMRSFRMKADRSLRKLENLQLQRLHVDIKDFQPTEVPGLNNGRTPWIATGKHLCGAATDFTLRCCASSMQVTPTLQQDAAVSNQSTERCPADAQDPEALAAGTSQHQQGIYDSCPHLLSKHKLKPIDRKSTGADGRASCQVPEAQSVLASKTTADESSDNDTQNTCSSQPKAAAHSEGALSGSNLEWKQAVGVQGLAVATCCHHRCSWQHYVGKPLFNQLGFSPDEFEVMSWMTGWALCGHETPAGEAGQDAATDPRAHTSGHTSAASSGQKTGQADSSTVVAEPAHYSCNGSSRIEKRVDDRDQASDDSVVLLSRTERMALGQKCKQLIDTGRVLWLAEQGFQVQSVLYVDPKISGENRLLLATRP
ncbi:hypothetical protein WJX77_010713 [Trebouxia sp. C0004]